MKKLNLFLLLIAFSLTFANAQNTQVAETAANNDEQTAVANQETTDPDAQFTVDEDTQDALSEYDELADADLDDASVTYDNDSKYARYKADGTTYFVGDNGKELSPSQFSAYKNRNKILDLIFRFLINTVFVLIIARCFYFPKSRRRDFFFTYILVGFAIFMLIHLMSGESMETGIGMGLFAIFCIMRYRTESVPIREMTYLFVIIALAALNGMAWDISIKKEDFLSREMVSMGELILTDLLFIIIVWLVEGRKIARGLSSKYIKYDKIDLITPEKRSELIADLKVRTGLDIDSVSIGSIDFLKDMALIKIFYHDEEGDEEALNKMPKEFG